MKLIYVAGRFSPTKEETYDILNRHLKPNETRKQINDCIKARIVEAVHASALLNIAGKGRWFAVCSHSMTAPIWKKMQDLDPYSDLCRSDSQFWYEGDLKVLEGCQAVVMLPGWQESIGAERERRYALADFKQYAEMNEITMDEAVRVIKELES